MAKNGVQHSCSGLFPALEYYSSHSASPRVPKLLSCGKTALAALVSKITIPVPVPVDKRQIFGLGFIINEELEHGSGNQIGKL